MRSQGEGIHWSLKIERPQGHRWALQIRLLKLSRS